ncbi:hypothetical protein H6F74_15395 [Trichocoleus sp. FACHB-90]|uniref:hypothetical protein n=1 Tax=Cyanophyceae TaxID=3028117 RepID=UPI0016833B8F|nr:hypothetical protein [Trichocoleus sp. FACHB-90]MBD1927617.1 hypothetical protein [Trichocoleus sp. FACHB-90]
MTQVEKQKKQTDTHCCKHSVTCGTLTPESRRCQWERSQVVIKSVIKFLSTFEKTFLAFSIT